tara:strand:+ start:1760 stop:5575 length:3816 start_codon:yes stop_codon:yes gene_type:complete
MAIDNNFPGGRPLREDELTITFPESTDTVSADEIEGGKKDENFYPLEDYNVRSEYNLLSEVIDDEVEVTQRIAKDVIGKFKEIYGEEKFPHSYEDIKTLNNIPQEFSNLISNEQGGENRSPFTDEQIISSFTGVQDLTTLQQISSSIGRKGVPAYVSAKAAIEAAKYAFNAPLPPQGKVIAGGTAGAVTFLGSLLGLEELTDAVFGERAKIVPSDYANEMFADVFFESITAGIPIQKSLAAINPTATGLSGFFRDSAKLSGGFAEGSLSGGAAAGAYAAETFDPGDLTTSFASQIVGGTLSPVGILSKTIMGVKNTGSSVISSVTNRAQNQQNVNEQQAVNVLYKMFDDFNEDPKVALQSLIDEGSQSTLPSVQANSPTLKALTASLSEKSKSFAKNMEKASQDDFDALSGVLHRLITEGMEGGRLPAEGGSQLNPWALASQAQIEYNKELFLNFISSNQKAIDDIYDRIESSGGDRTESSQIAVKLLRDSFDDIRAAVNDSYDLIPDDLTYVDESHEILKKFLIAKKDFYDPILEPPSLKIEKWAKEKYFKNGNDLIKEKSLELEARNVSKTLTSAGKPVEKGQKSAFTEAFDEWEKTAGKQINSDGEVIDVPLNKVNFNFFSEGSNNTAWQFYTKPISVKNVLKFRTRLTTESRKFAFEKEATQAKVSDELADGVLESIARNLEKYENAASELQLTPGIEAIRTAHRLTVAQHDIFSRSVAQGAVSRERSGAKSVSPELLLEQWYRGSRDKRLVEYKEFETAVQGLYKGPDGAPRFAGKLGEPAADTRLLGFTGEVGRFLNNLATEVFDEIDGVRVLNQNKLNKFLKDNKGLFDTVPSLASLRKDLMDAGTATNLFRTFRSPDFDFSDFKNPAALRRIILNPDGEFSSQMVKQAKQHLWVHAAKVADPRKLMQQVFGSNNPGEELRKLSTWTTKNLSSKEKDGFRDYVLDHIFLPLRTKSGTTNAFDQIENLERSLFKPINGTSGQPSVFSVLKTEGIIDASFEKRMSLLLEELKEVSAIRSGKNLSIEEIDALQQAGESLEDLLQRKIIRAVGASGSKKAGSYVGIGGTLQLPQAGADILEKILSGVPSTAVEDILKQISLPEGEEMLKLLLRKTPTPESQRNLSKKDRAKKIAQQAKQQLKDMKVLTKFFNTIFPTTAVISGTQRSIRDYQDKVFEDREAVQQRQRINKEQYQEKLRKNIENNQQKVKNPLASNTQPNPASSLAQRPPFQGQPAQPQQRSQFANMFPNDITSNIINSRNRGGIGSLV